MNLSGENLNPEFVLLTALGEMCEQDLAQLKQEKPPGWKETTRRIKGNKREVDEWLKYVTIYE